MLETLVSAQGGKSLHILDISCMKELPNGFEFLLTEHVKQSRPPELHPLLWKPTLLLHLSVSQVTYLKEYLNELEAF